MPPGDVDPGQAAGEHRMTQKPFHDDRPNCAYNHSSIMYVRI
jgi:hypothetical protein